MNFALASWRAPYQAGTISPFTTVSDARPGPGDVLLVRAGGEVGPDPGPAPVRPAELVRALRRRWPGCPVALWIPHAPPEQVIDLVRSATAAQVRAILGGTAPSPERLRAELTHPGGISTFVLRWAADAGYLPDGPVDAELGILLEAAPDVRTLDRLARERQMAARTWRGRLQQMGLPTPRAWLGLAHALHVAFFMQRHADEPLQVLCERLGLSTIATMSQQFRRIFNLSPGAVRDVLGAEFLLHRWFQARAPATR